MGILSAYFDESGKSGDHPVVTFGGVCGSRARVSHFTDNWEGLLRWYQLDELHMKRAGNPSFALSNKIPPHTLPERIAALKPFADCINESLEVGLLQAWDVEGFKNLSQRAKRGLGDPRDPYYTAFARALLELEHYVQDGDYLSLVCDDDAQTSWECYQHYRAIRIVHEDIKRKTVSLAFADSKAFPALQAADMVSWLARREARLKFYGDDFPMHELLEYLIEPKRPGKMQWMQMFADKPTIKGLSDADWSLSNDAPKDGVNS
jgi:hypothetical protein